MWQFVPGKHKNNSLSTFGKCAHIQAADLCDQLKLIDNLSLDITNILSAENCSDTVKTAFVSLITIINTCKTTLENLSNKTPIDPDEQERSKSIVIIGLPESEDNAPQARATADRNVTTHLLNELGIETLPVASYRMGKIQNLANTGRPRVLKIVLPSPHFQKIALANWKRNRTRIQQKQGWNRLLIRPALSPHQLQLERIDKSLWRQQTEGKIPFTQWKKDQVPDFTMFIYAIAITITKQLEEEFSSSSTALCLPNMLYQSPPTIMNYSQWTSFSINKLSAKSDVTSTLTEAKDVFLYLYRASIAAEVTSELESRTGASDEDGLCHLASALIFMHEENVEDALRVLGRAPQTSLEILALKIQCLLKFNRGDLAAKEFKKMQELDEDATITQLAQAWLNMAMGKEKLKDCFYIYQEMIDKYGPTPSLLISQASCLIQQQKYEEAEKLLQSAQERDPNNAEALVGLFVVAQFLGKPMEVSNRYMNQLRQDQPSHVWTKEFALKEQEFDRLA